MTERRIKLSFSFQRTISAHKEGHKLIIRGVIKMRKDLKKREQITTTLRKDLKDELESLTERTMIPKSKLMDVAVMLLLEKYNQD